MKIFWGPSILPKSLPLKNSSCPGGGFLFQLLIRPNRKGDKMNKGKWFFGSFRVMICFLFWWDNSNFLDKRI
jgi:hypothetical protein